MKGNTTEVVRRKSAGIRPATGTSAPASTADEILEEILRDAGLEAVE